MSKYIKLEDAISVATRGTNNYFICKALKDLPTIEVSEDNEPTWEQVQEYCFKRNFAIVGRETPKEYLRGFAEVSEDAISRANLIESFLADCECESREEARAVTLKLDYMLELIDDAPSVIPKAKEGEWKSIKASIYPYGYDVECSICGHRMGSSFGYKFCPMCGAKMKGVDDV